MRGGDEVKHDFADDLRSMPDLNDRQRYGLAKLLEAACNYGAGDALAGMMLSRVTADHIQAAAKLLGIDEPPSGSVPLSAMMLLSCKSDNPAVVDMLRGLDVLAANGQGCGYWASRLKPEQN
jgi:hypothetical protein